MCRPFFRFVDGDMTEKVLTNLKKKKISDFDNLGENRGGAHNKKDNDMKFRMFNFFYEYLKAHSFYLAQDQTILLPYTFSYAIMY